MKKIIVACWILSVSQFAVAQERDFVAYIIKNKDWKETEKTEWDVEIKVAKGSLRYLGAQHLDNPNHPQFQRIKEEFEKFKPSIAFYEGPNRGIADSDTLTIRKFGETGYVRFLAAQNGVKTKSLEPSPVALYRYLCTKFDQEKVDIYMLTKEAMRLRTRKNYSQQQIEGETIQLLGQFQKMLAAETKVKSISDLGEAFEKHFQTELRWWQLPASWFDPQIDDPRFTNKLATLSTEYRDIYMVSLLSEHIKQGENVFAVVGRNHVPLQANAIRYAVGLPPVGQSKKSN